MSSEPVRESNPFGPAAARRPAAPRREVVSAPPAPRRAPIVVRALTGYEEELIEEHGRDANTAALCNEILARCMVAPGADASAARTRVRQLLVAERDRALVDLRVRSLGPTVSSVATCPSCGRSNEVSFSLQDLPMDFAVPAVPVAVQLDDGGSAELRLPTAGDQEDLLGEGIEGASERRSWLLGRILVRYAGAEGPFDMDFARALPLVARRQLEAAVEAALPDLDFRMSTTCAHCGTGFAAPFDIPAFFLGS